MLLPIIDGDVLAYKACRSRWEKSGRVIDGINYVQLDNDGKRVPLEFTVQEDRAYLEESWENFKKDLERILEHFYATDYLMVVKGQDNFRNLLYPEYKLNRHADPTKTNMFVPVLRELAVAEGLAIAAHGREADDYIRIWAREASLAGDPYVICSIDKDLECIPGKHYKIPIKQNLSIDKGEIKEISVLESLHLYYRQLLMGDSTDNIPGIPGVGKVKATKYLKDTKEESEMQEIVVEHYMAFYGDEWFDYLLSNAKMIHLQRTTDDYFSAKEWPVLRHLLNL